MAPNSYHLDPPQYINTQEGLSAAAAVLRSEISLSVDTEANSLFAYQEQVCLIQISTKDTDYIIDTLSLKDFSTLGEIFYDPKIEKIFHASEYDILIMHDDFGFEFVTEVFTLNVQSLAFRSIFKPASFQFAKSIIVPEALSVKK